MPTEGFEEEIVGPAKRMKEIEEQRGRDTGRKKQRKEEFLFDWELRLLEWSIKDSFMKKNREYCLGM